MFDFRKRDTEKVATQDEENYYEPNAEGGEYYGGYQDAPEDNYGYDGAQENGGENIPQYDSEQAEPIASYDSSYSEPETNAQNEYSQEAFNYSQAAENAAENVAGIAAESERAEEPQDNGREKETPAEEVQLTFDPNDYVVNMMFENVPIFETDYVSLQKDEKDKFIECILESFRTSVINISALVNLVMRKNKRLTQCDEAIKAYEYQKLDFENYKRRNAGIEERVRDEATMKVAKSVLPTLDNFDHALPMIADTQIKEGVELIHRQLLKALASLGVEEMQVLGQEFDPDYHNAVLTAEASNPEEEDRIVEVMQKGYMLGSKVLRYAQVKVAK